MRVVELLSYRFYSDVARVFHLSRVEHQVPSEVAVLRHSGLIVIFRVDVQTLALPQSRQLRALALDGPVLADQNIYLVIFLSLLVSAHLFGQE